jgi:hypothetical protein
VGEWTFTAMLGTRCQTFLIQQGNSHLGCMVIRLTGWLSSLSRFSTSHLKAKMNKNVPLEAAYNTMQESSIFRVKSQVTDNAPCRFGESV